MHRSVVVFNRMKSMFVHWTEVLEPVLRPLLDKTNKIEELKAFESFRPLATHRKELKREKKIRNDQVKNFNERVIENG